MLSECEREAVLHRMHRNKIKRRVSSVKGSQDEDSSEGHAIAAWQRPGWRYRSGAK